MNCEDIFNQNCKRIKWEGTWRGGDWRKTPSSIMKQVTLSKRERGEPDNRRRREKRDLKVNSVSGELKMGGGGGGGQKGFSHHVMNANTSKG